jgi:soluble lytic murein transglycosylase-like protein
MDSTIFNTTFQASMQQIMLDLIDKYVESGQLASLFSASTSQSGTESTTVSDSKATPFAEYIQQAAQKYGLRQELVEAVIKAESNFDPTAVSAAGAEGLMQLMPETAEYLGVANSMDPEENISGGTKLLRSLLDRYDGNLSLALAAYNAGAGTVDKYNGVPPIEETQTYVQRVMSYYAANLQGGSA